MTPNQAAARLNRIAGALRNKSRSALTESAKQGAEIGKLMSRGPYSLLQLARMGHPYARRHLAAAATAGLSRKSYAQQRWGQNTIAIDYIINRQTGRFESAWKANAAKPSGTGSLIASTINASPEAKYLKFGTTYMIQRPIGPKVRELLEPIAIDNVREAVRRAVRTK